VHVINKVFLSCGQFDNCASKILATLCYKVSWAFLSLPLVMGPPKSGMAWSSSSSLCPLVWMSSSFYFLQLVPTLLTFPNIYFSLIKQTLPLIMQLIFKINYLFQFITTSPPLFQFITVPPPLFQFKTAFLPLFQFKIAPLRIPNIVEKIRNDTMTIIQ